MMETVGFAATITMENLAQAALMCRAQAENELVLGMTPRAAAVAAK